MNDILYAFLVAIGVVACLLSLPILSYIIGKFGAAGYFRAKKRQEEKQKQTETETDN